MQVLVIFRYYGNCNTSKEGLRSSEMLCGVGRQLINYVSRKAIRPIFKSQAVQPTDSTEVLISPYPDQEGNKLMFLSEWREFPSAPCLAGKKNLMTARVSMLLKWCASLTCFRA